MALKRQFNALKKSDHQWVYEVTKYVSQQPSIAMQRAFSDWLKDLKSSKPAHLKKRRLRFKKKDKSKDALKYGDRINGMTISRQADKWFVASALGQPVSMNAEESTGSDDQVWVGLLERFGVLRRSLYVKIT